MRVLSVNVAVPREVSWRGKPVTTGIYKEPVAGTVPIRTLNLDGDRQADLRVHGGRDKAVYAYPSEFYELWRSERPELAFPRGQFGENLTTEGLRDEDVSVGDRFRVGTAELIVTQPRLPCFKLGIKMGRDEFVTEFLQRGLFGFYLAVAREGEVEAGDPIVALESRPTRLRSDRDRASLPPRPERHRGPATRRRARRAARELAPVLPPATPSGESSRRVMPARAPFMRPDTGRHATRGLRRPAARASMTSVELGWLTAVRSLGVPGRRGVRRPPARARS